MITVNRIHVWIYYVEWEERDPIEGFIQISIRRSRTSLWSWRWRSQTEVDPTTMMSSAVWTLAF